MEERVRSKVAKEGPQGPNFVDANCLDANEETLSNVKQRGGGQGASMEASFILSSGTQGQGFSADPQKGHFYSPERVTEKEDLKIYRQFN